MARTRYIKPSIMTNEDLCELGMPAYILFTGLWMLADREGRLEDRPKRIKAEAMPLWENITWQDVESLVEKLSEKDFIHRYEVDGHKYIQIHTWKKHQNPHPRESASEIPPPPVNGSVSARDTNDMQQAQPRHVQGSEEAMSSRVGNDIWGMGNGGGGAVEDRGCGGKEPATPKTPPPIPRTQTQPPSAANSISPERRSSRRVLPDSPKTETGRPETITRKLPQLADRPRPSPEIDWSPHKPSDVSTVRESLTQLAIQIRMPLPDDSIVRQVLDGGYGATGEEIHRALLALWRRNKFRSMYSWGFVPLVVRQCFQVA